METWRRRGSEGVVTRSDALHSLSRDHHQALVAAQRLRRAEDVKEAVEAFLEFWREHGRRHFQIEEEVLLPMWAHLGMVDEPAAAQLALEHLRIRSSAVALEDESPTLAQLHDLGDKLAAHVRFEERLLFELIERDLGDDQLSQLARAVSDAEHGP
jgi:hemerythrin-like domain-containing protein